MLDVERVPQLPSGTVVLSGADPGQAATGRSLQELWCVASIGKHRNGRRNGITREAVRKRVHPDNYWAANRARNLNPPARRDSGELGERAALINTRAPTDEAAQSRGRRAHVHEP
jgi:hypothetical protein